MLYPAPGIAVPSPPPEPLEEVSLEVRGVGTVSAWHWPEAAAASQGPVMVFFHGNGENLETLRLSGTLATFAELGRPYLAAEFPGYGRSDGKASERTLVEAGVAAAEWMRQRYPGRPLIVAGWSLGAAVAVQVASRVAPAGLVMMSPWTSLAEIGRTHFPRWMVGLLVSESYDSETVARTIAVPALVVHGARDEIIPVEHGRRIAAVLPDARWIEVEGAGHNDLLGRRRVWDELTVYLSRF